MRTLKIVAVVVVFFAVLCGATRATGFEWIRTYDSPGGGADEGRAVAADGNGNIYVAGYTTGQGGENVWVGKYDSKGNLQWAKDWDGMGYNDRGQGIALDADGNFYVTGYIFGNAGGTYRHLFLSKFDPDGSRQWTRTFEEADRSEGFDVTLDEYGNIYVAGYEHRGETEKNDIFVRKYNAFGLPVWTQTYNGPGSVDDVGTGIAVDSSGNVLVSGYHFAAVDNIDVWVRQYDNDGNTNWTRTYDNPAHLNDYGNGVAVDGAGNVYVLGGEYRTDLGQDFNLWLRKYDAAGNVLWTQTYNNPGNTWDSNCSHGIAVDEFGNVYISAWEYRTDLNEDSNVLYRKYDTSGNLLCSYTYNGPYDGKDEGWDITLDPHGRVYIVGTENDLGNNNVLIMQVVPEASTLALIAPAILGLAGIAFRKMRK